MNTPFNITEVLNLPFQGEANRKNFLYLVLAILAGYVIPIVPMIIAMGYIYQMMAGMIRENREPHLPEWGDLGRLLADGFKLFVVRLVFMLPVMLPLFCLLFGFMFIPIIASGTSYNDTDPGLILGAILVPFLCMIPLMLLSFAIGILLMPAGCHLVAKDEISAAFRFKEWWPIFRINIGQFLLVLVVGWAISMVLSMAMQIVMMTIILSFLMIAIAPALSAYLLFVNGALEATAYRNGVSKVQAL
jgi:hypothetical protein